MSDAIGLAQRLAKVPATALRHTKRALNAYLDLEAQLAGAFELGFTGELESMNSPEHRDRVEIARIKSAAQPLD